jgi:C4-type Zn-finger protein
MFQEEGEESYLPLPIYASECPSCSSQILYVSFGQLFIPYHEEIVSIVL